LEPPIVAILIVMLSVDRQEMSALLLDRASEVLAQHFVPQILFT